jgi:hypothetical protein
MLAWGELLGRVLAGCGYGYGCAPRRALAGVQRPQNRSAASDPARVGAVEKAGSRQETLSSGARFRERGRASGNEKLVSAGRR